MLTENYINLTEFEYNGRGKSECFIIGQHLIDVRKPTG